MPAEEHDGGGVEEGAGGGDESLEVPGEAPVAVDPGEETRWARAWAGR